MAYFAKIHFPFVEFNASASWSSDNDDPHLFRLAQSALTPKLPSGMSVDFAAALIGTLSSLQPVHNFKFLLQFAIAVPKGSPEFGECLDAQSFGIAKSRVMIGTEDGETFASRLKWFQLADNNYPVGYLANGFELALDYIPPRAVLDFHFIVAYNAEASDDCAEWFAVDVPHQSVLQLDSQPISPEANATMRPACGHESRA